jgi:hypothetical protein
MQFFQMSWIELDAMNWMERHGRMVRMSDSQPEGRGFESRRGICEQDALKSTARGTACGTPRPNLSKKN